MLDPILIYKDQQQIDIDQNKVQVAIPFIQSIYDQVKALGLTISIDDMNAVMWSARSTVGDGQFESYFTAKFLALPAYEPLTALGISQNKILDMLPIPDISTLRNWIRSNPVPDYAQNEQLLTDYMEIVNDVVLLTPTGFADIVTKYSYMTKNDRGSEVASRLITFITERNTEVQTFLTYAGSAPQSIGSDAFKIVYSTIAPGVLKTFYNFIRAQEALFPNYVAA